MRPTRTGTTIIECHEVSFGGEDFSRCAAIRREVFVHEQQVPEEEEMDDLDEVAVHVLATVDGEPVGTGRLLVEEGGPARIGRMAVLQPRRGQGVGSAILLRLMEAARQRGARKARLAAQLHALLFYERFGFVAHGDVFEEAGIQHRWMDRDV